MPAPATPVTLLSLDPDEAALVLQGLRQLERDAARAADDPADPQLAALTTLRRRVQRLVG